MEPHYRFLFPDGAERFLVPTVDGRVVEIEPDQYRFILRRFLPTIVTFKISNELLESIDAWYHRYHQSRVA